MMNPRSTQAAFSRKAAGAVTGRTARLSWREIPENRILAQETLDLVRAAIDALPPNQRTVILLRDVDGVEAADVCNILQISESNQRVLLHRARAKVQASAGALLERGLTVIWTLQN